MLVLKLFLNKTLGAWQNTGGWNETSARGIWVAGNGKEKKKGRSSENKLVVLHLTWGQRSLCRFWVLLGQQESVCLCLLVKRTAKGYVRTMAQLLKCLGHILWLWSGVEECLCQNWCETNYSEPFGESCCVNSKEQAALSVCFVGRRKSWIIFMCMFHSGFLIKLQGRGSSVVEQSLSWVLVISNWSVQMRKC